MFSFNSIGIVKQFMYLEWGVCFYCAGFYRLLPVLRGISHHLTVAASHRL